MKKLFNYIKNLFFGESELKNEKELEFSSEKFSFDLNENLNQVTLIDEVKTTKNTTGEKPKKRRYYKKTTKSSDKNTDESEKPRSANKKPKNTK